MAGYWTGKKRSPETIEKLRKAMTGRKLPENVKGKLYGRTPWNKGKPGYHIHTEAQKQAFATAMIGNKWSVGREQTPEEKERRSIALRGSRSYLWKGGRRSLRHLIRSSFRYRAWRLSVFDRDDNPCVLCPTRGGQLEADHYPEAFARILDRLNITELETALQCTELWNVSNGRTLCKPCHKETDNYLVNYPKCQTQ